MAKAKLKKAPVEPEALYALIGQLKDALSTMDPSSDLAVGLKSGQALLTLNSRVYELSFVER